MLKSQKIVNKDSKIRCLIIEDMQNCFFRKGSMAFKNKVSGDLIIRKINTLINLTEKKDKKYETAGKSGKKGSEITTGARQKFYYDFIIYTMSANPPDHWTFSSHHYLRDSKKYKAFIEKKTNKLRNTYIPPKKSKRNNKERFLLPNHALTDGTNSYKIGDGNMLGIDFHNLLDIKPLFRPLEKISKKAIINKPKFDNRGFVIIKGGNVVGSHSAFFNTKNQDTGLGEFLKRNKVSSISVCGVGRETGLLETLKDSNKFNNIKERIIIYDATLPLGIDTLKTNKMNKDYQKDKIEGNKWLQGIKKKHNVNSIDSLFLFEVTESAELYQNTEKPSLTKLRIQSVEKFFKK